jgi:prepilin-type N-terminal cleavage/methylation domain-containing protein
MISEDANISCQRGMTMIEMLLVIAFIGLISSLISLSPDLNKTSRVTVEKSKQDFLSWYKQLSLNSLTDPRPQRICLMERRMVLQIWTREAGWDNSEIFYFPPPHIYMETAQEKCNTGLNIDNNDFVHKVAFNVRP